MPRGKKFTAEKIIGKLRDYLGTVPAGPVEDRGPLQAVSAECWNPFAGATEEGMKSDKLHGCMETFVGSPRFLRSPSLATAERSRDHHAKLARYQRPAPQLAAWLEENVPEALAVLRLPAAHRQRLRTTNGLERLNKEIKRRTRVAKLFPYEASLLRPAGSALPWRFLADSRGMVKTGLSRRYGNDSAGRVIPCGGGSCQGP